jgi:hypothetical protein
MTCRRSIADALPIPPQRRRLRLSRQRRALGARSNQISCKRQTAGKRAKQARNPIASARDRALQSRIYRPIRNGARRSMFQSSPYRFDFFFYFQLLAFHRRQPHNVRGRPFGFMLDFQIQIPVLRVQFAKPRFESHESISYWLASRSLAPIGARVSLLCFQTVIFEYCAEN